jgi:hypothetical protein
MDGIANGKDVILPRMHGDAFSIVGAFVTMVSILVVF